MTTDYLVVFVSALRLAQETERGYRNTAELKSFNIITLLLQDLTKLEQIQFIWWPLGYCRKL